MHSHGRRSRIRPGARSRAALGVAVLLLGGASTPPPEAAGTTDSRPGPMLRAARAALAAGDFDRGDALLAQVASEHPVVADHADLARVAWRADAGRNEEAVAQASSWSHPDSPLRVELHSLQARAYAALGEEVAARTSYERASQLTRASALLAEFELRIAESFQRSGKLEQAAEAFRKVWTRYPGRGQGTQAGRSLEQLERALGRKLRTASDQRQRAEGLLRAYQNEEALAAADQALAMGLTGSEAELARAARAESLFRLRRYPEATQAYDALPASEENRIQRARAVARAGDVPAGARALEEIGRASTTAQGTRALLLAAMLWEDDDVERARGLFTEVIRRAPGSPLANAARWQLGWQDYRAGRYDGAIRHWTRLEADTVDPIEALRPRYWKIRAAQRQGDAGAEREFAALATEYPLSYYGWRAAARAGSATLPRVEPVIARGEPRLDEASFLRARILMEAGWREAAHAELGRVESRARSLDDRLSLAALYAEARDYNGAQRVVVDAYAERLARGPIPGLVELWWHAWPKPFPDAVREATAQGGVEPGLLYSLMREESSFRPDVVSIAGARGLLQLMPSTAERVARELPMPGFTPDQLFDPTTNVRLGADYLAGLIRQFAGRTSAAVGSYNAGPHVVVRWAPEGAGEDDEWVEEIPYEETRAYVKRVLRSAEAYRVLY
jgi:soluble lytic murein transglycosylase